MWSGIWSVKMLGLTFSSKLDWGSYITSIANTASKKIGALIRSLKFLSPEVALYPYESTICPYMKYCCHIWGGAASCYLKLLDKLQKQICRAVGPFFAASFEPLTHYQNAKYIKSIKKSFLQYYFRRCRRRSSHYSERLHDFSFHSTISVTSKQFVSWLS